MFDVYWVGWIASFTNSADTINPISLTLNFPPGMNILATISVSGFSQSVDVQRGIPGMVGAGVRRWQVFNSDGSVSQIDPGGDPTNNGVFIRNCASVTFELATLLANAYAQVNVYTTS
ncbi:MAG TPA: hypothetical protein VMS64_31245 [Candidatus Methylomirabilis sp.]|nr:hypothetical protein [Candidatus Methylomirabilis sp.]